MQRNKLTFSVYQALAMLGGACLLGYSAQGLAQTSPAASAAGTSASASSTQSAPAGNGQTADGKKNTNDKKVTDLSGVSVTGQLAAIRKAQSIKQDAVNVVDSISAEETGKFPDPNVADALQRVPGVSVDRSGGESSQIAIRGFGPDFVAVTINGRQMATASGTRAFDFDVLPADIISVAQVNKTSSADIPEVDIGGVVDIQTARPLDFNGYHATGSAAGVNANLTGSWAGKTTPKVSGLTGWTNSDHTFGWLASVQYYKRDDTQINTQANSWYANQNISQLSGLSNPNYTHVAIPETLANNVVVEERTRKSFSGAIDWRPIDRLTVKFDTLYAGYRVDPLEHEFGEYGNASDIQSLTTDANNTVLNYVRKDSGVMSNDYVVDYNPSNEIMIQNGLNLAFDLDPSTVISLDVSNSKAWDKESPQSYFTVIGARNYGTNPTWTNNGDNEPPSYTNIISTTNLDDLYAHCCSWGGQSNNVTDGITQYQLNLSKSFDSGALSTLEFGVQENRQYNKSVQWVTPESILCNAYCGYAVSVPASAVGAYVYTPPAPISGVSQPGLPSQWIQYNPIAYFNWLATPAAYNQLTPDKRAALLAALAQYGSLRPQVNPGSFNEVEETDKAAFAKAVFEGTMWEKPWTLDVGARYVHVDSESQAIFQNPISYYVDPNDSSASQVAYGPLQPQTAYGGYHKWLPSMNFKLNLLDNLIYRLALSKTLTPPELNNLYYNKSFGTRPESLTITQGNPNLQPYTSLNYDTGLEWYINDVSYLSVETFYKKVSNFSTIVSTPVDFLGQTWSLSEPINLNSANIYGEELTFNYQFAKLLPAPFDGLGMAFNYTHVKSSADLSPSTISTSGKFAVPGIGDSANLSGYYEKGRWQVRLAYNWRGKYLESIAYGSGAQPVTRTDYGELDLSASYRLNNHVSLFVSGTNLTQSHLYDYSVYPNRFLYAEADGTVYTVGVRGTF
ncbi:TonB-dependent receptor [Dyella caseinilytica]|uniref:TonB-dependent receptor n=1 Tax=Dyella caseinilytica TaxID=1849581 RepID=A0ABX7GXF4_9GAMM|nr:TonB-dependent receptor [Dyella caseinilytica]QRN53885.1 TonB-dependent receptor [Dyella caseinilytica]